MLKPFRQKRTVFVSGRLQRTNLERQFGRTLKASQVRTSSSEARRERDQHLKGVAVVVVVVVAKQ